MILPSEPSKIPELYHCTCSDHNQKPIAHRGASNPHDS